MKNMKKWVALLLAVLMCASLCGCQELDDMRAEHAVWQKDGTILWNGNVFRKLDDVSHGLYDFYVDGNIKVTDPDVPVLLSAMYGTSFRVYNNEILHGWDKDYNEIYFIREDRYDDIMAYLQQGVELTRYFYTYWNDGEAVRYDLTRDQCKLIDELLSALEFSDEYIYVSDKPTDFTLIIGRSDEEQMFQEDYCMEIISTEGEFYLMNPTGSYAMVPSVYHKDMQEIVKAFCDSGSSEYIFTE